MLREGEPFALSGGLNPRNVSDALAQTGAALIDVSSGVESAPGEKDARSRAPIRRGGQGGPREQWSGGVMSAPPSSRSSTSYRTGPDERGHFGLYGGRYRRRDADAADPRSGARLYARQGRPELPGRARRSPRALCRPPEPALFRRAADRASRRRQDLFQARRAQPHRRAQDQQLPRPDPCSPAAWARRRIIAETGAGQHGVAVATVARAFRPALRHLYGRDRHRAAEAERVPHEAARRRGEAGDVRLAAR